MIIRNCVRCRQEVEITCTNEQYLAWRVGESIQHAMPNVPAGEREMLISGMCDRCWKEIFKEEDND